MHLEELRALPARHARPGSRADPGRPALGFGLTLEPSAVAELLLQAGPGDAPRAAGGGVPSGIAVSDAPAALLDAVVRLLRLLDEPRGRAVPAPLVKREILWRLITGDQGTAVRHLGLADSVLQEARLLLATHPGDATGVGRRVGYDNPSQFSREYRRQFGAPPEPGRGTPAQHHPHPRRRADLKPGTGVPARRSKPCGTRSAILPSCSDGPP